MPTYTYDLNDHTYTVTIDPAPDGGYHVIIDGVTHHVDAERLLQGGWLLHQGEGRKHRAYVASRDRERYVLVDGQPFTLKQPDPRRRARAAAVSGVATLNAEMPGQVIDVLVSADDTVEKGQTLVIMEAMKMEMRVAAPGDGTVKRVLVSPGDVVERGQLLVEVGE